MALKTPKDAEANNAKRTEKILSKMEDPVFGPNCSIYLNFQKSGNFSFGLMETFRHEDADTKELVSVGNRFDHFAPPDRIRLLK